MSEFMSLIHHADDDAKTDSGTLPFRRGEFLQAAANRINRLLRLVGVWSSWAMAIIVVLIGGHVARAEADEDYAFFESRIRPVLVEHCYACHSAAAADEQKLQGGLQLDTRQGLLQGGDLGPAVIPGQPEDSLLILALRQESGLEMPPDGPLPETAIADFERWIQAGAPDPRQESAEANREPAGDDGAARAAAARTHWAFQPPRVHPQPVVRNGSWPQAESDYFVLARLEQLGLKPVATASRPQLLRRMTLDLIGLPPTLEEVEAFVRDESPQALDRVLDRLLASPHYGERWGRFWLDVARYADDKALAYHNPWPEAYRYRDWVVEALNRDMPYDQFLALQLAGDLLPEFADQYSQLAALGFQGLGAIYHKGNFPKQVMADELDDRIDTLTRGLLGLTVACARCHDHKYDPISTADYYSLAAAYNEAKWVELPLASPEVVETRKSWEAERKQKEVARNDWLSQTRLEVGRRELEKLDRYLLAAWRGSAESSSVNADLHATFVTRCRLLIEDADVTSLSPPLRSWVEVARRISGMAVEAEGEGEGEGEDVPEPVLAATRDLVAAAERALLAHDRRQGKSDEPSETSRSARDRPPQRPGSDREDSTTESPLSADDELLLQQLWIDQAGLFHVAEEQVAEHLDTSQRKKLESFADELARLDAVAPPDPPRAHGVAGGGAPLRVHIRGNVERLGDEAPPGFLPVPALPQSVGRETDSRFTRLDLARAICTADNPLTARVIVNRIWQQHFGQGIVSTPSNFGLLGTPPTHPELLDTLAVRFMESGWSLKWLHREIIRSATYQLSSRGDRTLDGDSTASHWERDPGNRYLWKFAARRVDFESLRDSLLAVSGQLDRSLGGPAVGRAEAGHNRRTIYSTISRREPDKMLVTFDFPDPNVTAEGRNVTTVPQQQLFALNSDFMHQAAQSLAARAVGASEQDRNRIRLLYQWVLSRDPRPHEFKMAREFLESITGEPAADPLSPNTTPTATASTDAAMADENAWEQLAHALLATNEFVWVD